MKKLIFISLIALAACNPAVKETTPQEGKCDDIAEMKEVLLDGTTNIERYDLNGDGEVTIADLNYLIDAQSSKTNDCDSVK